MKCNQSCPGIELVSPCTYPVTITITPRAPWSMINQKLDSYLDMCYFVRLYFISNLRSLWLNEAERNITSKFELSVSFIRLSTYFYHTVRFTIIYHFNIYIYIYIKSYIVLPLLAPLLGSARSGSTALSYRKCVITLVGGWWGQGSARAFTRCMMNIYIYIYSHSLTDFLVVSALFSVARHTTCSIRDYFTSVG